MARIRTFGIALGLLAGSAASQALAGSTTLASAVPSDFSLAPDRDAPTYAVSPERTAAPAYPNELQRVTPDDAAPPPRIVWEPNPTSMVKLVPAKVRYRLKF